MTEVVRRLGCARNIMALVVVVISLNAVAEDKVHTTKTHRFEEVADGVYLAQTTAPVFNSNSMVIVNEDDVVIIDSHVTPSKARDLIKSIKTITRKPIKTLINTHFHWDHAHGNQVFGEDVQVIGHEFTRKKMLDAPLQEFTYRDGMKGNAAYLARLQKEVEEETDKAKRKELKIRLDLFAEHVQDFEEITPQAPDTTLSERMTIVKGSREIQIHYFGRAHTGGDLVILLPKEKVVYTGDMMLYGPSFLADGYVREWVTTLQNLKSIDFETIVPGHGSPFKGRERISYVQAYYTDLWDQVAAMHEKGMSIEETVKAVDLSHHKDSLGISRTGSDPLTVRRIFARLEGAP